MLIEPDDCRRFSLLFILLASIYLAGLTFCSLFSSLPETVHFTWYLDVQSCSVQITNVYHRILYSPQKVLPYFSRTNSILYQDLMIPAVPNQVWITLPQTPPVLTASDEPGSGEPQVPPPGHQASQLEPRPGQRGGQGRGEAAQERWAHDSDDEIMMMTSASCVNLEASHLSRLSVSSPRLVIPVTPESGWAV